MEIVELVTKLRRLYDGLSGWSTSDIIKFALKKQIPQEAEWTTCGWKCPSCGCMRWDRFSHCVACGRALKRTEIE